MAGKIKFFKIPKGKVYQDILNLDEGSCRIYIEKIVEEQKVQNPDKVDNADLEADNDSPLSDEEAKWTLHPSIETDAVA